MMIRTVALAVALACVSTVAVEAKHKPQTVKAQRHKAAKRKPRKVKHPKYV